MHNREYFYFKTNVSKSLIDVEIRKKEREIDKLLFVEDIDIEPCKPIVNDLTVFFVSAIRCEKDQYKRLYINKHLQPVRIGNHIYIDDMKQYIRISKIRAMFDVSSKLVDSCDLDSSVTPVRLHLASKDIIVTKEEIYLYVENMLLDLV